MKAQEMNMTPKVTQVTVQSSASKIAGTERARLGFKSDDPRLSADVETPSNLYNILRQKIESFNIFVFQTSMQIEDVRGVTLFDKLPVVIVINSKDSPEAKIFSLLHEYGHVLLKKDGICMPQNMYEKKSYDNMQLIEKWCNDFAASILMPEELFRKEYRRLEERDIEREKIVNALASKFRASRQAVTIRMRNLEKDNTTVAKYSQLLQKIKNNENGRATTRRGGLPRAKLCVSRKGKKFVSLVLESESRNIINISDVAEYLEIKLKHLKEVEKEVF